MKPVACDGYNRRDYDGVPIRDISIVAYHNELLTMAPVNDDTCCQNLPQCSGVLGGYVLLA